jgi:hypothetical protein
MVCSRCSCRHEAQICVRSLPWQLSASWSAQRCFDELTLAWCSIEPEMRIGSESRSGIVYKIAMKHTVHTYAAMKLMIHDADAENEVIIATFLSDRVKSGQSKRFPTVLGSAICQQTALDPATDFGTMVKQRWLHIFQLILSKRHSLLECLCQNSCTKICSSTLTLHK